MSGAVLFMKGGPVLFCKLRYIGSVVVDVRKIYNPLFLLPKRKKRIARGVASTYIVTTDFNPLAIKSR
jgi:hypothetical protein